MDADQGDDNVVIFQELSATSYRSCQSNQQTSLGELELIHILFVQYDVLSPVQDLQMAFHRNLY